MTPTAAQRCEGSDVVGEARRLGLDETLHCRFRSGPGVRRLRIRLERAERIGVVPDRGKQRLVPLGSGDAIAPSRGAVAAIMQL
jgi:hypothetical protein